jgi:hypothetical protein
MRPFDNLVRSGDDECFLATRDFQNKSIGDYMLFNSFVTADCRKDKGQFDAFVANNPNLRYKDGFGYLNSCVVDKDSEVRNNSKFTNEKEKSQLCTRWYQAVPSLNKGGLVVNIDSRLKLAEDTSAIRDCQRLSERDFDRFVPLTPCLANSIQDPKHIIPSWTWGGIGSRNLVHDQPCGFQTQS